MPRQPTRDTASILAARSQGGTFTLAQAASWGITSGQLRAAERAGTIVRLRRGSYAIFDETALDIVALLRAEVRDLRNRGHAPVVGARTAAQRWDIAVIPEKGLARDATPTLLVPPSDRLRKGRRGQVLLRLTDIPAGHITELDGLPITTPMRTGIDVVREVSRSRASAITTMASCLRRHAQWRNPSLTSEHDVTAYLAEERHRRELLSLLKAHLDEVPRRGSRIIGDSLPFVDPRLETALEGLSWGRFTESSLPLPTPQAWVCGASGRRYRVDFLWGKVIGEADGAVKYLSGQSLWEEKQRQSDLEAAGYAFVRWTWDEMFFRPDAVLRRIARALQVQQAA